MAWTTIAMEPRMTVGTDCAREAIIVRERRNALRVSMMAIALARTSANRRCAQAGRAGRRTRPITRAVRRARSLASAAAERASAAASMRPTATPRSVRRVPAISASCHRVAETGNSKAPRNVTMAIRSTRTTARRAAKRRGVATVTRANVRLAIPKQPARTNGIAIRKLASVAMSTLHARPRLRTSALNAAMWACATRAFATQPARAREFAQRSPARPVSALPAVA